MRDLVDEVGVGGVAEEEDDHVEVRAVHCQVQRRVAVVREGECVKERVEAKGTASQRERERETETERVKCDRYTASRSTVSPS